MLFVHARTKSIVVPLHANFLAIIIAVGMAFVPISPTRGEESLAYSSKSATSVPRSANAR